MTLDAMDWVWRHARSRGNARVAVLAVADKINGPEATARLGVTEAMRRLGGVGKGTAVKALADAVAAGDLEIAEPAQGSRAALYRIPGAVGYVRRSGPDSGPQTAEAERSEIRTTTDLRSGSRTTNAPASGPESGPVADAPDPGLWSGFQTACGPESGPHHPPIDGVSEGVSEGATTPDLAAGIPEFARPLVDRLTAARVYVSWSLTPGEWFTLDALIKRSGADMLAEVAARAAARREIRHARYFLRAWRDLPPAPAPGTAPATPGPAGGAQVIPLTTARPSTTDQRVAAGLELAARLRAQEGTTA